MWSTWKKKKKQFGCVKVYYCVVEGGVPALQMDCNLLSKKGTEFWKYVLMRHGAHSCDLIWTCGKENSALYGLRVVEVSRFHFKIKNVLIEFEDNLNLSGVFVEFWNLH